MKKLFYIFLFSGILGLVLFLITADISLGAAPSEPQLLSPTIGATVFVTPNFRWSNVGAEWYHLYVFYYGEVIFLRSNLTSTSYSVKAEEALSPGTTYIWQVRACNPGPECTDSVKRSFTTREEAVPGPTPSPGPIGMTCPGQECSGGAVCIQNPLCAESFQQLIDAIINFIFWIGMAIAPIMFVIAGFLFVTSAGDPNRVATAKKMMLYTAIGLAVVLLAKGLIAVLKSILGA